MKILNNTQFYKDGSRLIFFLTKNKIGVPTFARLLYPSCPPKGSLSSQLMSVQTESRTSATADIVDVDTVCLCFSCNSGND